MKIGRRILTAVLAAALLVTTACSQDTTWVAEHQSVKLPAGVYNFYMMNNYSLASSKVENPEGDVLSQKVEDVAAEQWIKDATMKDMKRYFAIDRQFEQYGFALTEQDTAAIKEYAASQMEANKDFLTKNGISLESLELYFTNNYKSNTMFMKLYGEGGELEIPANDMKNYFTENYVNSQYIVVPKFDPNTGEPLEGEALEAAQKEAKDYYDRAAKGEESFSDILLSWELAQYEGEDKEEQAANHTHEESDHDIIMQKTALDFPEKYMELVNGATIGTPVSGEDDNYFYIILRKDVMSSADALERYTQQLMVDMKTEEYKGKVEAWAEEVELSVNDAAVKLYTPKKLSLV